MCFKYFKNGKNKVRIILPGKLTPYVNSSIDGDPNATEYPYQKGLSTRGNQQVRLLNGKYRHIASYSLEELRKMGWDGAMYNGGTYDGVWVPFIDGYDSDPDHEYEPFDIAIAKRSGTAGTKNITGLCMSIPGHPRPQIVRISHKA